MHARLSPSSSARWLNCTASVAAIEAAAIVDTGSEYADEGTFAHDLAAKVLAAGLDPFDFVGMRSKCGRFQATEEFTDHVNTYVEYVRSLQKTIDTHCIEHRVPLFYSPQETGTIDAALFRGETWHVVDLKFGRGVPVSAEENTQLMIYALSSLIHIGEERDVTLHIVQPRIFKEASIWVFTVARQHEFRKQVEDTVAAIRADEVSFHGGEKQCRWCPLSGMCEGQAEAMLREVALDFDDLTADVSSQLPKSDTLTADRLAKVLAAKAGIQQWLKDVEAYAMRLATAGGVIPGYKLVEGRSMRTWIDDDLAEQMLRKVLPVGDCYSKKVLSPAAAERALKGKKDGKNIRFLRQLIHKPAGKLSIVSESDGRTPVESEFEELD